MSLVTAPCLAFETETHALITRAAYERSDLNASGPGSLRERLGIDRLDAASPFAAYWEPGHPSNYYMDGGASGTDTNQPEAFEVCQMEEFFGERVYGPFVALFADTFGVLTSGDSVRPIQNWLVRGAIREDDLGGTPAGVFAAASANCGALWLATILKQPAPGGVRPYNHFYDPNNDVGLEARIAIDVRGQKSVDWALGYVDSFASPQVENVGPTRNHYSYLDARSAFWAALTKERSRPEQGEYTNVLREADAQDRLALWATTFRSLGNVVHLLEDTGQPQHTRNDPHSAANSDEQKAFEGYTNARVLGSGDPGNYLRGFFGDGIVPLSVAPLGTYGIDRPVMFATPLSFFTTRKDVFGNLTNIATRAGLADYTNRGFFTGGTLPGLRTGIASEYQEPLPPQDFLDPANGYSISFGPCEGMLDADPRIQAAVCLHYLHEVPDVVDPTYPITGDVLPLGFTAPSVPIASESIFAHVMLQNFNFADHIPLTALSITELEATGDLTIPRAVGYASGFLDFFFRGQLTLTSPPDGLYGVVDQGTPHDVHDGVPVLPDGTTFGFSTIRVRVRNTTPDIQESGTIGVVPQSMTGSDDDNGSHRGQLVAIARYHRNPCYRPDLSGEMSFQEPDSASQATVPAGCASIDQLRTPFMEISVSAAVDVDGNGDLVQSGVSANACANVGNINSGVTAAGCENDSALMEFDFSSDPIPINATDLFLQVAYRGPLGSETDGIAVGSKDILEPAYFSEMNTTDWFLYNNEWLHPEDVPAGVDSAPEPLSYMAFCFNKQRIGTISNGTELQPGDFARIAILSDIQPLYMGVVTQFADEQAQDPIVSPLGQPSSNLVRQSDRENGGSFTVGAMFFGRGTTLGFGHTFSFQYYPDYDLSGVHYAEMWNLAPTLGGASTPGIPTQVVPTFASAPDDDCGRYYPGAWPGDYLQANGDLQVKAATTHRSGVGSSRAIATGRTSTH